VWPALSGRPGLWSLVLAAGHCLLVLPFGGAEFLLASGDRHLLWPLVANKEGLMSLPPYCAIYCAGAAIGRRLRVGTERQPPDLVAPATASHRGPAMGLTVASVKLPPIVTEPSRLLFNAGFLITCLAACCQVLLMLTIGRLLCLGSIDRSCSPVLALIGRCSLAYFLLANLLTGAVNLTVDTVAISDKLVAMGILIVYLICLVGSLPLLSMVIGAWQQRGLAGSRSKAE
uniref:G_PROTEIN_RECEP_F3_4 domain-containing protein n=1 Tax=Macrostomum lignano TaxID=282301 RepID=A0A1I8FFX5_9PLAT